ncbi:MAG: caspase family protein [Longimicrobiales bacterium]
MTAAGRSGRALAALALAASMTAGTPEPRAPERWAVIVGINDYAAFDGIADGDLRGAVNDATSMYDVLVQRWGFPEDHVRLLLDADATAAAIEEAVTGWLPANLQPGDLALFFYAGHGSQALDHDGDEPDGLDETIAPQDVTRGVSDRDITDDELRAWFAGLPTDQVIVIFDSCHSGTATRALSPRARPRSLPRDLGAAGTRGDAAPDALMSLGNVMLEIAAAAPDQVAMDWIFPQERGQLEYAGGAFTTHLVRQLWRAEPGADYRSVFTAAFETLKADRFEQDPQLAGASTRSLFGVEPGSVQQLEVGEVTVPEAPPELFVVLDDVGPPVFDDDEPAILAGGTPPPDSLRAPEAPTLGGPTSAVDDAPLELRVAAGAAMGVTVGSLFEMGEGLVRVVEVRRTESVVAPVAGLPSFTGLARLAAYAPRRPVLMLNTSGVDADLAERVRASLAGTRIRVADSDDADLYLVATADGVDMRSRSGALRARIPDGPDRAAAVRAALDNERAAQMLAAIDNPAARFDVGLAFAGSDAEFRVRDPIAFSVTSERDGYLTLVDLGPGGAVTVLYPNRFAPDGAIQAGRPLDIPTSEMPFRLRASEPAGWGMVRALVTPEPLDLPATDDPLLSSREGAVLAAEVMDALARTLAVGWPHDVPLHGALPVTGWATALVNYQVIP